MNPNWKRMIKMGRTIGILYIGKRIRCFIQKDTRWTDSNKVWRWRIILYWIWTSMIISHFWKVLVNQLITLHHHSHRYHSIRFRITSKLKIVYYNNITVTFHQQINHNNLHQILISIVTNHQIVWKELILRYQHWGTRYQLILQAIWFLLQGITILEIWVAQSYRIQLVN